MLFSRAFFSRACLSSWASNTLTHIRMVVLLQESVLEELEEARVSVQVLHLH